MSISDIFSSFFSQPKATSPTLAVGPLDALPKCLVAVAPHLTPSEVSTWTSALTYPMGMAAINTPKRIAAFLGQIAEETGGFTALEENLNYSATRLIEVWPSRFPNEAVATPYEHNPVALANNVYADRLGNGNDASGDGWKFRGGGCIQLTGRDLYTEFGKSVGKTADEVCDWVRTPPGAAASAVWYWNLRALNPLADVWNIHDITQKVNGGQTNAQTRLTLSGEALKCLG